MFIALSLVVCVICICVTAEHITSLIVKAKYPVYDEPSITDVNDDEQPINFDDVIAELYNREEND